MQSVNELINQISKLDTRGMYQNDFLLSWDKSDEELKAVFLVAEAFRALRENNVSADIFNSGLAISIFKDSSTRTRFSLSSAANFLGLAVQDLDEGKSQIVHGEMVRETANMVSFMADVIGIRDCMNIGKGNTYMQEVADSVQAGYDEGILAQRPVVVNMQCDIDHPTQTMADAAHLINYFGGIENLRGKKVAMTWAYSPSYGKPLSVPQGIIGLLPRFGMDVVLAHPKPYGLMPETEKVAQKSAQAGGGSFTKTSNMAEAFADADIVYPKSWASYATMERRTEMFGQGDFEGIEALSQEMVVQNADYKGWECTEELMASTKGGKALYMHCLPADITGVSCTEGEVSASVFDRYRVPLYMEASYKPYIIAAMFFLGRVLDPARMLSLVQRRNKPRMIF